MHIRQQFQSGITTSVVWLLYTALPALAQEEDMPDVRYVTQDGLTLIQLVSQKITSPAVLYGVVVVFALLLGLLFYIALGIILMLLFTRQ